MGTQVRECAWCGNFKPMQHKQRTCSMPCRSALAKKERLDQSPVDKCPVCEEIAPLIYTAFDARFCSKSCVQRFRKWADQERNGIKNYGRKPVDDSAICDQCLQEYKPVRYKQRFCCRKCSYRWRYHNTDKKYGMHKKRVEAREKRESLAGGCSLCGTGLEEILPSRELGSGFTRDARLHRDHIVPVSRGGTDDPANMRMICWLCNMSRLNIDSKHDTLIAAASKAFWSAAKAEGLI